MASSSVRACAGNGSALEKRKKHLFAEVLLDSDSQKNVQFSSEIDSDDTEQHIFFSSHWIRTTAVPQWVGTGCQ